MKEFTISLIIVSLAFQLQAQPGKCQLQPPAITIHFGSGNIPDLNIAGSQMYERIYGTCPTDGHYSYTTQTSNCFRGDWLTITDDHTAGDVSGNMMLVNSSHNTGTFFSSTIRRLKSSTTYEFAVWLMNVCRISDKCPFPLLPNILTRLQTPEGKTIAQFGTGDIVRREVALWTRYQAYFTTPPSGGDFILIMSNNNPGGCGNDFALDDITFRECVRPPTVAASTPTTPAVIKRKPAPQKPLAKKTTPPPVKSRPHVSPIVKTQKPAQEYSAPVVKQRPVVLLPPPPELVVRKNSLVKLIETEAGEISIHLYDNGEIDGDTVSIYHNNKLLKAHARLSQKPVSFHITVDAGQPHHELVMVAENLGSIPPNTSMMVITAGSNRYEIFISSTEQMNAKVILDLKK